MRDRQVQQARKAHVEVVAAQAVQPPGAFVALADDSGLPQHPEVAALGRTARGDRLAQLLLPYVICIREIAADGGPDYEDSW